MTQPPRSTPLSPVRSRQTVSDSVFAQLRQALMWGQFEPGQLITIDSIASQMGTSHMPVREALRRLSAENGLDITRAGTARVPGVSRARLDDICLARIELEGFAAERAARNTSRDDIARIEKLMREHEAAAAAGEVYNMLQHNQQFHFALYDLAASQVLSQLIGTLWLQMGPYMRLLTESIAGRLGPPTSIQKENTHAAIVSALYAGNARAVRRLVGKDIGLTQTLLQSICGREATTARR